MNLIVLEDHDALREVTVARLQELGHRVRGIACAEELDEVLASWTPHILLLDLNLPGEDGTSVANRVRTKHPEIGIIMVTARDALGSKVEGYESGADIYLTKPTSMEELIAAIEALSRRISHWAGQTFQAAMDTEAFKAQERARALHQQLIHIQGKLPTLENLSVEYGCSPRQLNEDFCALYGQPIYEYMMEYRFAWALRMVQETTVPIKMLADQLGYSHVNHFISAFGRKFGSSPGLLRKEHLSHRVDRSNLKAEDVP